MLVFLRASLLLVATAEGKRWIVDDGLGSCPAAYAEEAVLVDSDSKAAVRCCGRNGIYDQCPGGSQEPRVPCATFTYAEADAICSSRGLKLCPLDRLGGEFGWKVCGNRHVWIECPRLELPPANNKLYLVNRKTMTMITEITWKVDLILEDMEDVESADDLTIAFKTDEESVSFLLENPAFSEIDTTNLVDPETLYIPDNCVLGANETCVLQDWVERNVSEDDGYASLSGEESSIPCGGLRAAGPALATGLNRGEYRIWVKVGSRVIIRRPFLLYQKRDMNPAPPTLPSDTVLHVAPYALMPRRNYSRIPSEEDVTKDGLLAYEETFRVNAIIPWEDDVYFCLERSGIVYKVSGTLPHWRRNGQLRDQARNPWFDVYQAIWDQTAPGQGNGPQRKMDFIQAKHSGLRVMVHHPDFSKGTGYVYTSHLEVRPGTTVDADGVRSCESPPPSHWKYAGDFEEFQESPFHACGEGVVVEWYFENDVLQPRSYRQLVRMAYSQGQSSHSEYQHPIKQIRFQPGTKHLWIGSGDGSLNSNVIGGGQNKNVFGKILRVDVEGTEGTQNFRVKVPRDNYAKGFQELVCAVGFRNPHGLTFVKTGQYQGTAIVFDAGRDNIEEVNVLEDCSDNYGWSNRAGPFTQYDFVSGTHNAVGSLPSNDADFGFRYPAAYFGHERPAGGGAFSRKKGPTRSQCGVGGIVVENSSPLSGKYFYSNFPQTGEFYFSELEELMNAKQKGPSLTSASVNRATFAVYDNPWKYWRGQPPNAVEPIFHEVGLHQWLDFDFVKENPPANLTDVWRTDVRIGEGVHGEILIVSKRFGTVHTVLNSLPDGIRYRLN